MCFFLYYFVVCRCFVYLVYDFHNNNNYYYYYYYHHHHYYYRIQGGPKKPDCF